MKTLALFAVSGLYSLSAFAGSPACDYFKERHLPGLKQEYLQHQKCVATIYKMTQDSAIKQLTMTPPNRSKPSKNDLKPHTLSQIEIDRINGDMVVSLAKNQGNTEIALKEVMTKRYSAWGWKNVKYFAESEFLNPYQEIIHTGLSVFFETDYYTWIEGQRFIVDVVPNNETNRTEIISCQFAKPDAMFGYRNYGGTFARCAILSFKDGSTDVGPVRMFNGVFIDGLTNGNLFDGQCNTTQELNEGEVTFTKFGYLLNPTPAAHVSFEDFVFGPAALFVNDEAKALARECRSEIKWRGP